MSHCATFTLRNCPAPAKLNLFLHVTGRRPDGYHLLQTVFQLIDHGDLLHFELRDDGIVRRTTEIHGVPEASDLTVRAAQLLKSATRNQNLGADIAMCFDAYLEKMMKEKPVFSKTV